MTKIGSIYDEEVFRMPPLSMATIEHIGEAVLETLFPQALARPTPIDCRHLVETSLPANNINVYPARAVELGAREALTQPHEDGSIEILMTEEQFDALYQSGRASHRARATLLHEVGHAALHIPVIQKYRLGNRVALSRTARSSLAAFEDPEWQAWALGGCVLAPRRTILMLTEPTPASLSEAFAISESMASSHLKRLKMLR